MAAREACVSSSWNFDSLPIPPSIQPQLLDRIGQFRLTKRFAEPQQVQRNAGCLRIRRDDQHGDLGRPVANSHRQFDPEHVRHQVIGYDQVEGCPVEHASLGFEGVLRHLRFVAKALQHVRVMHRCRYCSLSRAASERRAFPLSYPTAGDVVFRPPSH